MRVTQAPLDRLREAIHGMHMTGDQHVELDRLLVLVEREQADSDKRLEMIAKTCELALAILRDRSP